MAASILVIEPDGYTANHLSSLLAHRGYRIHHEPDGRAGLSRARELRPDISVVDLHLPDMDGRSFLQEVKTSGIETQVLMVSGQKNFGAVVACMKLGALDFIEKPFHPDEFLLALSRVEDRIRLESEVRRLRTQLEKGSPYHLLFGNGNKMRDVQAIVDQIADTDITVLLRGESGTGKDVLGRTIWQCSSRRDKPYVKINCAALPRDLLESELFGYDPGAFTGATISKPGKFEYATGGTVLLDEITEMHIDLQAKLLHVLQDGEVCRLGGKEQIPVDVRVIAATNQNLEACIHNRTFRNDLYYRLNVVNIVVPPLRDRREDIPTLVEYFVDKFAKRYDREPIVIPDSLMQQMQEYHWPGNVRELENYVRRMAVLGDVEGVRQEIRSNSLASKNGGREVQSFVEYAEFEGKTLKEVSRLAASRAEKVVLEQVLQKTRWNRRKAAEMLDISYKALLYKIRDVGLG